MDMPRASRVADGTVVLMKAGEGEPREEATITGYDQNASRYIVKLTSNDEEHRVPRSAFDVPEGTDEGSESGSETPAVETPTESHRHQADPNSPAYQKDPEKFFYERGYADGKRGHDFNREIAVEHPRYARGFAKHREVPEDLKHLLEKPAKAEEPAAATA